MQKEKVFYFIMVCLSLITSLASLILKNWLDAIIMIILAIRFYIDFKKAEVKKILKLKPVRRKKKVEKNEE